MPGSGKSYWCGRLAKKLKTNAYDLDKLIESLKDDSIRNLFESEGEEYFRRTEAKLLRWFAEKKDFVLATGGGTPCFHDNMPWMNKQGVTIWIDVPVNILAERLQTLKAERPLLSTVADEQLEHHLEALLETRKAFYQQAQHRLSSQEISEKKLTELLQTHA